MNMGVKSLSIALLLGASLHMPAQRPEKPGHSMHSAPSRHSMTTVS